MSLGARNLITISDLKAPQLRRTSRDELFSKLLNEEIAKSKQQQQLNEEQTLELLKIDNPSLRLSKFLKLKSENYNTTMAEGRVKFALSHGLINKSESFRILSKKPTESFFETEKLSSTTSFIKKIIADALKFNLIKEVEAKKLLVNVDKKGSLNYRTLMQSLETIECLEEPVIKMYSN